MGSFDVLARLAKQAVDEERQALHRINVAISEIEQRIEDLRLKARAEAGNGQDFMTVGATLPAYLRANEKRVLEAAGQLRELQQAHADQLQKLRLRRIEWKRCETLVERQKKRMEEEMAAKEQKKIDELAIIKAGRTTRQRF